MTFTVDLPAGNDGVGILHHSVVLNEASTCERNHLSSRSTLARWSHLAVEKSGFSLKDAEGVQHHDLDSPEFPLPSWWKFNDCWRSECPKLRIMRPREDVCNCCFQFANGHKHGTFSQEEDNRCCSSEKCDSSDDKEEFAKTLAKEQVIVDAFQRVKAARVQHEIFDEKKA